MAYDRDKGHGSQAETLYHDSEDSLDSNEIAYAQFIQNAQARYDQPQAHIEEIDSQDDSQTSQSDHYSGENHLHNHRPFLPPSALISHLQSQSEANLIPFGQHHFIEEPSLISPARYQQWTSPETSQMPTSQLSYDPDPAIGSRSSSVESGTLIDHPSADHVDQYSGFEAACPTPSLSDVQHETGQMLKRRVEPYDGDDDWQADNQKREVRVKKKIKRRLRSPEPSRSPSPSPPASKRPEPKRDQTSSSSETIRVQSQSQTCRGRKRSIEEVGYPFTKSSSQSDNIERSRFCRNSSQTTIPNSRP